jgi:hypothetical protein
MKVKIKDLKLADVVRLGDYQFADAVVKQIKETQVILFRPYATTADFSYTGGVIPLIGIEEVILLQPDNREVEVLSRKDLK